MNISVAGTGYVGLSIATLLAQHNHVTAVDILRNRVDMINSRKSPIQDDYIEEYLATKELDLTATLDWESGYKSADFIVIATPIGGRHICRSGSARDYYTIAAIYRFLRIWRSRVY